MRRKAFPVRKRCLFCERTKTDPSWSGNFAFGCAFVITENDIPLFPEGEFAACVIGLAVMVMGYRKDDGPNGTDSERQGMTSADRVRQGIGCDPLRKTRIKVVSTLRLWIDRLKQRESARASLYHLHPPVSDRPLPEPSPAV